MEPASSVVPTASYYFDSIPREMFESIAEYVAEGPLIKKEGFDDTIAEQKLADMHNKISHEAIVDLEALHSINPGYKNPVIDAIFRSKLPEVISTTNIKRGRVRMRVTSDSIDEIRASYPFLHNHLDISYRIDRTNNQIDEIKVRGGVIQEFIKIQKHYFVATDRGLFIYDSEKDKENPLLSLDVKLEFLHAGSTNFVLVGRCKDGRFMILDFTDKEAPKVHQTVPKASKLEFIKNLFINIIYEPAKAIASLAKKSFAYLALGVLATGIIIASIILVNTVALPLIVLLGQQLVLTMLIPIAFVGVFGGFYFGINLLSDFCSGIQKSKMQYNCYFS